MNLSYAWTADYTGDGYDCVPFSADPGNRLAKRSQSDEAAALPSLTKRRPFAHSNAQMRSDMKEVIAKWTLSGLQVTGKQVSSRQGPILPPVACLQILHIWFHRRDCRGHLNAWDETCWNEYVHMFRHMHVYSCDCFNCFPTAV